MDKELDAIIGPLLQLQLEPSEKQGMRLAVLAKIKDYPVSKETAPRLSTMDDAEDDILASIGGPIQVLGLMPSERIALKAELLERIHAAKEKAEPEAFWGIFVWKHFSVVMAVMVLLIGTGGGFAYAAEFALPGDFLYSFKTNINEEVVAAFNWTAEAQTNWSLERTERRLQEAEALAENERLTAESRATLTKNIEERTKEIKKRVSALTEAKETGRILELQRALSERVQRHQTRLSEIVALRDRMLPEASQLLSDVHILAMDELQVDTSKPEERPAPAMQVRSSVVGSSTVSSQKTKEQIKADADASLNAEVQILAAEKQATTLQIELQAKGMMNTTLGTRLNSLIQTTATARLQMRAGNYKEAERIGRQTLRALQELKVDIKAVINAAASKGSQTNSSTQTSVASSRVQSSATSSEKGITEELEDILKL